MPLAKTFLQKSFSHIPYCMNSYISLAYLILFLPAVVLPYAVMPKNAKPYVLLAASVAFAYLISHFFIIYLVVTALSVYVAALLVKKQKERCKTARTVAENREEKKIIKARYTRIQLFIVSLAIILNIGILSVLKYSPFFLTTFNQVFAMFNIGIKLPLPKFHACIGISFYTLQAVSYIHDVYKDKVEADTNFARLALYMSFFPIIMEGPICRYADTALPLWEGKKIEYKNFTYGLQRIAYGIMKKVVVADRTNLLVTTIFREFQYCNYDGGIILLGAVMYTIELYMEFSGTIDIVIGSAEIFGITIPENFRQPFFAKSISEFWQRWHITLGTWFRDYIFYPVTMSKPMKKLTKNCRKKLGRDYGPLPASIIAFFCVWLCNGLWHGAGWEYIFFGMYHFALISLGALVLPLSNKLFEKLHLSRKSIPYKIFAVARTCILVCIGEMFFNARGLNEGFKMFKILVSRFSLKAFFNGGIFTIGMDRFDYIIVAVILVIVLIVGIMREKGRSVRDLIAAKPFAVRFLIFLTMLAVIIIFGAYGKGYIPINPIYANF